MSVILGNIALKHTPTVDSYFDALTFLIERFFINLKEDDTIGIIVFDSVNKTIEGSVKKKFTEFVSKEELVMFGRKKGYYRDKIYPSLFFSNDEYSTILQSTDLIATSLNSAVWNCIQKEWKDGGKRWNEL